MNRTSRTAAPTPSATTRAISERVRRARDLWRPLSSAPMSRPAAVCCCIRTNSPCARPLALSRARWLTFKIMPAARCRRYRPVGPGRFSEWVEVARPREADRRGVQGSPQHATRLRLEGRGSGAESAALPWRARLLPIAAGPRRVGGCPGHLRLRRSRPTATPFGSRSTVRSRRSPCAGDPPIGPPTRRFQASQAECRPRAGGGGPAAAIGTAVSRCPASGAASHPVWSRRSVVASQITRSPTVR